MTSETIQLIIGIGQILAVAVIPIIIWFCGIKYQNRKARRNAQLGKTGADWDSAPEQTGTLLMRQS